MPFPADAQYEVDAALTAGLPALGDAAIVLSLGDTSLLVAIRDGEVTVEPISGRDAGHDFQFRLDETAWSAFCQNPPPRGYTSAQAMHAAIQGGCVSGDLTVWATYARLLDRVVESLREKAVGARPERHEAPASPSAGSSPIEGRYHYIDVQGDLQRIYVETAGQGQVVLCLHTAGADSRQFRYLLEDQELLSRYRFVAFDMPWHGRSAPPDDWASQTYRLTTTTYAATILATMDALALDRPVLMGCSMGGAIALYMAAKHGDRFSGVCALEGGLGNPGRFVPWTNHIAVDHSQFLTSWVGGLIAPRSPSAPREQTLWGYAQSGPGVYQGDTYFYSRDLPEHRAEIGKTTCPLWVFSGEYDYSATTEMSREAAEAMGGELVVMEGSGHFPMSEDPEAFRQHLVPVLEKISAGGSA